jgi:hypothetical protein
MTPEAFTSPIFVQYVHFLSDTFVRSLIQGNDIHLKSFKLKTAKISD